MKIEKEAADWKNKLIFTNLFPISFGRNKKIYFYSFCVYKPKIPLIGMNTTKLSVNDTEMNINFIFNKGIKIPFLNIYINYYYFKIDIEKLLCFPVQNKTFIMFDGTKIPIIYNAFDLKEGCEKHGRIIDNHGTAIYFRQSIRNAMYLTVRKTNITDKKNKRFLIFIAYILAKFSPLSKKVLLYEKETNRYEESASVVYERLIDEGYKNVFFIIKKTSEQLQLIKEKYVKNLIHAHTFKHYYMFFKCRTFISSESLQHSLELRVANRFVGNKLKKKKFKYVFLQHGVMYMISIDADNRGFFRKGASMPNDAKIVVSSKKEASHFIEKGGFNINDFYICGLPKFDKAKLYKNPDKITIMPTWRPWEHNEIRNDYHKSGYYKMVMEIISAIPSELKEKIVFLPHPLIKDVLENTELNKYIPPIITYDLILRETKVLITDYSSIAYDSFYRGSNIVFWWKDKDDCLKKYNGNLMLKPDESFGDICYNKKELMQSVNINYIGKQLPKYKRRYKKIVEFDDNKNTERLIEKLMDDQIIKR